MAEILAAPPGDADLITTPLPSRAFHALRAVVADELGRYPDDFDAPPLLLVAELAAGEESAHARWLDDTGLGVLTPALDLRGNVHRVIAAALLDRFPDAARRLAENSTDDPQATLFRGLLRGGERAALVAAAFTNRPTLDAGARVSEAFATNLAAARTFLDEVGLGVGRRSGEPPAPAAWTSELGGRYPDYEARPGDVPVRLAARLTTDDGYRYEHADPSLAESISSEFERLIWVLPEGLLSETTDQVCVVEDVDHPRAGVSGYARGARGGKSTIVVERVGLRRILFHELGHAIHGRFRDEFPDEVWDSLTPPDAYFGDAKAFIRTGVREPDYTASLLERGFITSYSTATKNEDVAELTEALFDGDDRLWASLEHAPVVASKIELLIEFLRAVHPLLTRRYFEMLTDERRAQEALWSR